MGTVFSNTIVPKAFFAPDITIKVHKKEGSDGTMGVQPAKTLCQVDEASNVHWDNNGLQLLGMSPSDVVETIKNHHRQRK